MTALLLALVLGAGPERLGVFQFGVVGADPALAQTAIDTVATVLGDAGFAVVSRSDLDAMLGAEKLRDAVGCTDISCMAEIGAAAGVERVVAGSLSRLDGGWVVSMQLINTRYASVENRVTLEWPDARLESSAFLGAAAELLAVPASARAPGEIRLSGVPADAAVLIDGVGVGLGTTQVPNVTVGVHRVRVEAPGFLPWDGLAGVRSGKPTHLTVSLTPGAPFYTRWWFWTATAALVGGGVLGAILATRSDAASGSGDGDASGASGSYTVPSPLRAGARP